jgi:hypothetical protein
MGHTRKNKFTAVPTRDLGHAKWTDSLAALENPHSKEFKAAVVAEDANWSQGLQHIPSSRLRAWRRSMVHYQTAAHPVNRKFAEVQFKWCGHTVQKQRGPAGYTTHVWIDGWHQDRAWTAVGFGEEGWFYTLEDIGKGAEHLELTVWRWTPNTKAPRPLWRRDPVGPSVEIVGNQIYFSTVENLLRYPDIWVADVATGHGAKCLFTEPDKRFQVGFEARDGGVFVHKANALDQMLGILEDGKVRWIAAEKSTLIPIGIGYYGQNDAIVFYGLGKPNVQIALPEGEYLVDACLGPQRSVLVVTVNKGCESVWIWNHLQRQPRWECILRGDPGIVNSIQIFHEDTEYPTFLVRDPRKPDVVWEYHGTSQHHWKKVVTYPEPLRLPYSGGGLAGDAEVPYTWISGVRQPRALLIEGYGAYGISARRAYPERWLPYLAAGWAVAYVCPRGGREGGDAWYDGGRTAARKAATFEDTATAIKALQKSLQIPPRATVFFGRSAGGWLAANIAQAHGDLVAAVYAEVPYVDVLRTTTNPTLPLTQLEYDEFGDPTRRQAEYRALLKISPVDTVPACNPTGCPIVVIRTALHDKQVLPYEALKWSARLRGAGWGRVYVGIDHDGGHFAAAKSMAEQRAEDACLLESAIQYLTYTRAAKTLRKKSVKRQGRSGTEGRTRRSRSTRA